MSTPTKKLNGKKEQRVPIVCPHADTCAASAYHAEVMASLDEVSKSVGMLLEQTQQHSDRIVAVAERLHEVSQRQVVADQREEAWLEELGRMTRALRREEE